MRITHVVENLNRGGLERVVIDLIEQQQSDGHTCQVVCLFEPGKLASEIAHLGVPLISCEKTLGLDIRAFRKMRSAFLEHDAGVVHTHNAVAHYYAVCASAFLNVRRVNTRHGMGSHPLSWKRESLYRFAIIFSDVAALVCASARVNFIKHHILPATKAVTVYNGIPVDRFSVRNPTARQALLLETGWSEDSLIMGKVARLNPLKDHQTLLHAMAIIYAAEPRARLVLIGDGEMRAALEKCCGELGLSNVVCFLGDRSDVNALLPALDIFVMSSITEGYSISLLEACASALPIVATDVGGNGEIVVDGRNGYLVPPKMPALFAEAALRLIRDPAARAEIGQLNRKFAEDAGSVRAMAHRYEALYQRDFTVQPIGAAHQTGKA